MKVILYFFAFANIWAQSLQILPAPPSGNPSGSFQIMIASAAARPPVALQWRLSLPDGVAVADTGITAGDGVRELHKALTCVREKSGGNSWSCILAGGVQPIPDGPVARVRFTSPRADSVTVRLSKVLGASADSKPAPLPDAEMTMRVGKASK